MPLYSFCIFGSSVIPPSLAPQCASLGLTYTPRSKPYFLHDSERLFITSPLPPFQGVFLMLYPVVVVCHQQKPPTCLATSMIVFAPHDLATSHHWSVFNFVGLICFNDVVQLSYSLPCHVAGL